MNPSVSAIIIDRSHSLTLEEFCQAIATEKTLVIEMVDYQLLQPEGAAPEHWRFDSISLKRGKIAVSFYRDLEINLPGVALALELLDKIDALEHEIKKHTG